MFLRVGGSRTTPKPVRFEESYLLFVKVEESAFVFDQLRLNLLPWFSTNLINGTFVVPGRVPRVFPGVSLQMQWHCSENISAALFLKKKHVCNSNEVRLV